MYSFNSRNWISASDIIGKISPYCDFIACWNNDPDIFALASGQRKSGAEIVLLFKTLSSLKQNKDLLKAMHSVKRIFKYSARTLLQSKTYYNNPNMSESLVHTSLDGEEVKKLKQNLENHFNN